MRAFASPLCRVELADRGSHIFSPLQDDVVHRCATFFEARAGDGIRLEPTCDIQRLEARVSQLAVLQPLQSVGHLSPDASRTTKSALAPCRRE
jgi:hypothetical protein